MHSPGPWAVGRGPWTEAANATLDRRRRGGSEGVFTERRVDPSAYTHAVPIDHDGMDATHRARKFARA